MRLVCGIVDSPSVKLVEVDVVRLWPAQARMECLRDILLCGVPVLQHSIRVNDQIRICFVWKDGDCYEVEIIDYHS